MEYNNNSNSNKNTSNSNLYTNNDPLKRTTYLEYGQDWLVEDAKTLQELGENSNKLRYLEKSLKSIRRIQQKNSQSNENIDDAVNQKYKYDKNSIVGRKFPFKGDEFKYPNDGNEKPKSLYIKYSDEYGSKKPNDIELPGNIFIIIFIRKILSY
jgi:hypothetical protein